ncbi:hypothetical protein ABB28_03805 [Stenotrophomonas chelatiphaga]|uniref:Uncharacterized protein n=1 Tax=Stenotrophomonas chelatiphaga TaxID=517011 RepID=A0A0R0DE91_9GAMM|nr:hypothetical protein ABB28_03805 [Stenotrophomonas chelatiphaga]
MLKRLAIDKDQRAGTHSIQRAFAVTVGTSTLMAITRCTNILEKVDEVRSLIGRWRDIGFGWPGQAHSAKVRDLQNPKLLLLSGVLQRFAGGEPLWQSREDHPGQGSSLFDAKSSEPDPRLRCKAGQGCVNDVLKTFTNKSL